MRKLMLLSTVLLGLLAIPATASALKFTPAAGSPLTGVVTGPGANEEMPPGYSPSSIATSDFNDDGYDDVAVVSDMSQDIYLYLGQENGTLEPSASNPIAANSGGNRYVVHAADLDQDGDIDLVTGSFGEPALEVYLNRQIDGATTNPHESFGTTSDSTASLGSESPAGYVSASFGDKDDDGDTDIVLGLYGNKYVYLRNDDGVFSAPSGATSVPGFGGQFDGITSTTIGDFDGDGAGDLAMISNPQYDPEVTNPDRLLLAKSSGSSSFGTATTVLQTEAGDYLSDVQSIDLNGDEYDDLVFKQRVAGDDVTRTALGSPSGLVIQDAEGTSVKVYGASPVAIGDYDDDGSEDIALPQFVDSGLQVAVGDGNGKIALDQAGPFAIPSLTGKYGDDSAPTQKQFYPQASASLDANGDGRLDVAMASGHSGATSQARGVAVMLNQPTPGISVTPSSIDFGEVPADAELIAPETVTIHSTGDLPLDLTKLEIGGIDPEPFQANRGNCPTTKLPVGSSCDIQVTMSQAGARTGLFQATLKISSDASEQPVEVSVFGTLLEAPKPPSNAKLSLKVKSAKKIKAGKALVVSAIVSNTATDRAGAFSLKATGPKKLTGKIKPKILRYSSLAGKHQGVSKFRVPVKRNAKGKLRIKVSLTFKGKTTTKQTGKIKILSKRRR